VAEERRKSSEQEPGPSPEESNNKGSYPVNLFGCPGNPGSDGEGADVLADV